ncbi:MAG: beta-galactosidase [Candidatus Hydrogenedentes bacterium]|nr:beta-galactosidase [Candidatus Hydrogenedentota bacterium]
MLYPRVTSDFSQNWRFNLGDVENAQASALDDSAWESVTLPHSWNAADTFTPSRGYHRGKGWYRKRFTLDKKALRKKLFIEFGAAFAVADVWLNEQSIGRFMGGFTGFTLDVTDHIAEGENLIAIALDNTHDPDVLPGKEIPDYNLYGGLYREAALVLKDRLHIPEHGVAVTTPTVSPAIATITAGIVVRNERRGREECTCTASVRDASGALVIEKREALWLESGAERLIVFSFPGIRNPALWSPANPYLYTLAATIEQEKTIVDNETVSFGFRTFEFTRDRGFILNGQPLKLRGVNRHQDYPGLGNAVPHRLQVRDAEIIKEMGGNFVRCSHYPQHPAFLDACDRLGILVYEEIASWQYIGGEQFMRNAQAMMRQMIVRDKNHPSIILWGLLNEGRNRDFFARLNATAHRADPTRPTVYAENHPEEGRQLGTVTVPDVLGINYELERIDAVRALLPDQKLLSSEHTNADFAVRGETETELLQIDRIRGDLNKIEARPYMAGGALWSMHDYGTDYEPVWPIQHSGVLDAWRLPKEAFHYIKSRWSREPALHICGHWTWPGQEGVTRTVSVVHNCDAVELFLNGQFLGQREHMNPARWEVPYTPGTLAAVGIIDGRRGQKTLKTAGPPSRLNIVATPNRIRADGSDVAEITVWVTDEAGTTVPCEGKVVFAVEGSARLRGVGGLPETPMTAGTGRILVQAAMETGPIRVEARYAQLPPVTLDITAE